VMGFHPALRDGADEETCGGLMEVLPSELCGGETWGWAWVRRDFVYGACSRSSVVGFALSLGPLTSTAIVKSV
jgi:hypothetical protein